MLIACSGVDYFHHLLHRMIEDRGGPGNLAQLRLRLDGPLQVSALARSWAALGQQVWTVGGRWHTGLRGCAWSVRGPVALRLEQAGDRVIASGNGETGHAQDSSPGGRGLECSQRDANLNALAVSQLRQGLPAQGPRLSLALTRCGQGVVLTWDHRLLDARGALGVLAALPRLAAGGHLRDRWWVPGHRRMPEVPQPLAARGSLARQSIEHLRPHRLAAIWRPAVPSDNPAAPVTRAELRLTPSESLRLDARIQAASGRFSETPFLLTCLTAAIGEVSGGGGEVLFPMAIDARPRLRAPVVANCHTFLFLRQEVRRAVEDLPAAARHLKDAHRRWAAAEMGAKMACALEFFPWLGERLARQQLGYFQSGVAASCLVGNAGQATLPDPWFGTHITDVGHATTVPGRPGLAALFHRFAGRFGCDLIAAGGVAAATPPESLVARLRHHLLVRDFPGAQR